MTCTICGKTDAPRYRRELCENCYKKQQRLGLFHLEKPESRRATPAGLDTFQAFVWRHRDKTSIKRIAEHWDCPVAKVRAAMDCCVLALHGRL